MRLDEFHRLIMHLSFPSLLLFLAIVLVVLERKRVRNGDRVGRREERFQLFILRKRRRGMVGSMWKRTKERK